MRARLLLVVLLLVSVTACGGGEPVVEPIAPAAPAVAPALEVPAAEDAEGSGFSEYWSPSAVASLEAAKASYVAPPKKSAETAATSTTQTATAPVPVASPSPTPSPSPAPSPAPQPSPSPTYSPTPTPTPTHTPDPKATEPAVVFVEVTGCLTEAGGTTYVEYVLHMEGTSGWSLHLEDNTRNDEPETITGTTLPLFEDPEETGVLRNPTETEWSYEVATDLLPSRFAVPSREDVLLRSPQGTVTSIEVIGLLVPRSFCVKG